MGVNGPQFSPTGLGLEAFNTARDEGRAKVDMYTRMVPGLQEAIAEGDQELMERYNLFMDEVELKATTVILTYGSKLLGKLADAAKG